MLAEDGFEFDLLLIDNQLEAAYRHEQSFDDSVCVLPQIDIFELESDRIFYIFLRPRHPHLIQSHYNPKRRVDNCELIVIGFLKSLYDFFKWL